MLSCPKWPTCTLEDFCKAELAEEEYMIKGKYVLEYIKNRTLIIYIAEGIATATTELGDPLDREYSIMC